MLLFRHSFLAQGVDLLFHNTWHYLKKWESAQNNNFLKIQVNGLHASFFQTTSHCTNREVSYWNSRPAWRTNFVRVRLVLVLSEGNSEWDWFTRLDFSSRIKSYCILPAFHFNKCPTFASCTFIIEKYSIEVSLSLIWDRWHHEVSNKKWIKIAYFF